MSALSPVSTRKRVEIFARVVELAHVLVNSMSSTHQPPPGGPTVLSRASRHRTRMPLPANAPRSTSTRFMAAAEVELPVHAARPVMGLWSEGSAAMVPLYPPEMNDAAPTSTQVTPPSVLTSRTPPSKPAEVLKRCQKIRWLIGDRSCGGAINRSSLMPGELASLVNEWLLLWAWGSITNAQVALAGKLFCATWNVHPGSCAGSRSSMKWPVGTQQGAGVGVGVGLG